MIFHYLIAAIILICSSTISGSNTSTDWDFLISEDKLKLQDARYSCEKHFASKLASDLNKKKWGKIKLLVPPKRVCKSADRKNCEAFFIERKKNSKLASNMCWGVYFMDGGNEVQLMTKMFECDEKHHFICQRIKKVSNRRSLVEAEPNLDTDAEETLNKRFKRNWVLQIPNECDSFPQGCPEDSSCQELSKRKICVCKVGLEMIGNSCKDINECDRLPPVCGEGSGCKNTIGSYTCTENSKRETGDSPILKKIEKNGIHLNTNDKNILEFIKTKLRRSKQVENDLEPMLEKDEKDRIVEKKPILIDSSSSEEDNTNTDANDDDNKVDEDVDDSVNNRPTVNNKDQEKDKDEDEDKDEEEKEDEVLRLIKREIRILKSFIKFELEILPHASNHEDVLRQLRSRLAQVEEDLKKREEELRNISKRANEPMEEDELNQMRKRVDKLEKNFELRKKQLRKVSKRDKDEERVVEKKPTLIDSSSSEEDNHDINDDDKKVNNKDDDNIDDKDKDEDEDENEDKNKDKDDKDEDEDENEDKNKDKDDEDEEIEDEVLRLIKREIKILKIFIKFEQELFANTSNYEDVMRQLRSRLAQAEEDLKKREEKLRNISKRANASVGEDELNQMRIKVDKLEKNFELKKKQLRKVSKREKDEEDRIVKKKPTLVDSGSSEEDNKNTDANDDDNKVDDDVDDNVNNTVSNEIDEDVDDNVNNTGNNKDENDKDKDKDKDEEEKEDEVLRLIKREIRIINSILEHGKDIFATASNREDIMKQMNGRLDELRKALLVREEELRNISQQETSNEKTVLRKRNENLLEDKDEVSKMIQKELETLRIITKKGKEIFENTTIKEDKINQMRDRLNKLEKIWELRKKKLPIISQQEISNEKQVFRKRKENPVWAEVKSTIQKIRRGLGYKELVGGISYDSVPNSHN